MNLTQFLKKQSILDNVILDNIEHITPQELIVSKTLALMVEAGEFADELKGEGFKYWSRKHKTDKILEEFVDIFFFWLSIANQMGFTEQDIEKEYVRKWYINIERQKEGY